MPSKGEILDDKEYGADDGKCKKNRYSIRRILDRSRFSPRLLRLTRLSKSVDCDGNKGANKLVNPAKHFDPSVSGKKSLGKGNIFDRSVSSAITVCTTLPDSPEITESRIPVGGDTPQSEFMLEEDYEESLAHFADAILEGLRTGSGSGGNTLLANLQSSPELSLCSDLRARWTLQSELSRGTESPIDGPHANIKPSVSHHLVNAHSTVVSNVMCSDSGIYNEPCDAKPCTGEVDSATIYTLASLAGPLSSSTALDVITQEFPSAVYARSSLQSSPQCIAKEAETQSLRLPTGDKHGDPLDRTNSGANQTSGSAEPIDSIPQSNGTPPSFSSSSSSSSSYSAGQNVSTSGQSPDPSMQGKMSNHNVGYVGSPRGNSVIVHHALSPFARVPMRPNHEGNETPGREDDSSPSHLDLSNEKHIPQPQVDLTSMSEETAEVIPITGSSVQTEHYPDARKSPTPIRNVRLKSNPNAMVSAAPISGGIGSTKMSQSRQADAYPTYEEAWDLKMARQLGYSISNLAPSASLKVTAPPITPSPVFEATSPPMSQPVRPMSTAPLTPRLASERSSPRSNVQKQLAATGPREHRSGALHKQAAGASRRNSSTGLQFHENLLFDNRAAHNSEHKNGHSNGTDPHPGLEYDYAYNGSWSLGVKFNLNLAMHQEDGAPLDTSGAAAHISPDSALSIAPQPTHIHGSPGVQSALSENVIQRRGESTLLATATNTTGDTASTDSLDECWGHSHARLMGELTNSRLIDPSDMTHVSNAPKLRSTPHNATPPAVPLHQGNTNSSLRVTSHTGLMRSSPASPLNNANSTSSAIPTTLSVWNPICQLTTSNPGSIIPLGGGTCQAEMLPLEDQSWYHPSLTRSEAEDLLFKEPNGSFLVRKSETCANDYSLTIKYNTCLHMKISRNPFGQFILGEYSQPYGSVPQMIYHYARTSVPVRGAEFVTLHHPICRLTT